MNSKRKKLAIPILLGVFTLISFNVFSQELPQIVPPSPNAAALAKYVEMPVSTTTGIPNINVPIYTINEGQISLPINLSYHAGGIRVEEIASWVGLGWSLNAGGLVTRTTKGLPDDTSSDGLMYTTKTIQDLYDLNHTSNQFYNDIVDSMDGENDYEADMFSFNFMGYSGKFAYDQENEEFFQMPYSNIKIEPVIESGGTKITSWVFTTPDGMKFYFGISEDTLRTGTDINASSSTFSHANSGSSLPNSGAFIPSHITSWYLMDIISPNEDQIKFFYDKQIGVNQLNKSSESYILGCSNGSGDFSASFVETTVDQTVIDKIEFSNGKIEFIEETTSRTDLSGSKALKTIKIYALNSLLKQFNLTYDYTVSAVETGKWTSLGNATQRRYRLRLKEVEEENNNSETLPPYEFTYNSTALPSRFSNAQDYWGFYNSKTSNVSLIPETYISGISLYTGDANRTVDPVNSKAGILTKVTYPTGGSAEYFYESNTASDITSDVDTDYNLRNRLTAQYMTFVKAPANVDPGFLYAYSKTFTIGNDVVGQVEINTTVTGCNNSQPLTNLSCDYLMKILGVTDTSFSLTISDNSFSTTLPSGNYKIVAIEQGGGGGGGGLGGGGGGGTTDFTVTLDWTDDPHPEYLNVGGQRIQKVVLNDDNGNTLEKTYEYDLFGQSLTSGYIISTPVFLYDNFWNGSCSPATDVYKITSYSQAPMAFVKGNVLAYSNVAEFRTDDAKTEYTFSKHGDFAHSTSNPDLVHLPDLYIDWIRGTLTKKEDFTIVSGVYKSLLKTENEYERVSTYTINNFGLSVLPTIGVFGVTSFNYGFYSGMSEWYRPTKTTTTSYYDTDEVVTVQEYAYDSNKLLASSVEVTTSDADPMITKNYYPEDVTSVSALGHDNLTTAEKNAIDALKTTDLHRIGELIQTETYKDLDNDGIADSNELLSTQRTNFKEPYSDMILPGIVQTAKGTGSLDDRIEFESYYANGKVREVKKADGTTIVYIWGYDEQHPVAKIENASYSDIPTGVYSSILSKSDLDDDNCVDSSSCDEKNLRTELNKLRNSTTSPNLTNALITTYTYDPLIGVTSMTDPRGQIIYYHYDEFYRLEYVTDGDNKVLSKNEYNYKN